MARTRKRTPEGRKREQIEVVHVRAPEFRSIVSDMAYVRYRNRMVSVVFTSDETVLLREIGELSIAEKGQKTYNITSHIEEHRRVEQVDVRMNGPEAVALIKALLIRLSIDAPELLEGTGLTVVAEAQGKTDGGS